ncbi:MAG TPA: TadE/TadG family type IV pilus assembly protein [Candidatus Limnocylindrales bacterium]|nr:TadE/TadG family type IV pilus assembly protein [Candidatus Limnocylindrales bacterium]
MLRTQDREKGASAIEFALAMPIVFLVLFGVFEFGLALWYQQELTSAVREGARKGVVMATPRKTSTEITDAVKAYMTSVGLSNTSRTVTCTNNCPCTAAGQTLTVTATYPSSFQVVSNLTKLFYGSSTVNASKTLSATVSMQCE